MRRIRQHGEMGRNRAVRENKEKETIKETEDTSGGVCYHLGHTGKLAGCFWRSPQGPGMLVTSESEHHRG